MTPSSESQGAPKGARTKYTSRACQECRRRRAKCDGQRPACSRCTRRSLDCVFTNEAEHRGSGSRSCLSVLQARIQDLEQVLQWHSIDADASIAQMRSQKPGQAAKRPLPVVSQPCLRHTLPAHSAKAPSGLDPIADLSCEDNEARFFGATSGRRELEEIGSEGGAVESGDILQISNDSVLQSRAPSPFSSLLNDLPEDLIESLIDLYFQWEHPWCQVVDEVIFRRCRGNNGRYCSPLLLYSMLAVASRYSDRIEVRRDPNDPNTAGLDFMEHAESLLQADLKWPRITTIQSLAIMAVFYVAVGSDAAGWLHHGMAIRLVLDMGLNMDSVAVIGSSHLSQHEVFLRRQIYWSLYCNDKLWATYTGRVCTMLDSQGSVPLPCFSDVGLSGTPSTARDVSKRKSQVCFLQKMSTHCQILERILTNLYSPKSKGLALDELTTFDAYLSKLQNWLHALPACFYINVNGRREDRCKMPHLYTLHMVYHTSVILVCKSFAQRFCLPESDACCSHTPPCSELKARVLQLCHESAQQISILGDCYRERFGSFRRSPMPAAHCTLTAAHVLLCVHRSHRNLTSRRTPLQFQSCLDTLKELSESWTPPRRFWQSLSGALGSVHLPATAATEGGPGAISSEAGVSQAATDMYVGRGTEVEAGLHLHPQSSFDPGDIPPLFDLGQFEFSSETLPWDYVNFDMPNFDFAFAAPK